MQWSSDPERGRMGLLLKLEATLCAVGLIWVIGTSASIVNAYSSYFDYNGIYFGTLQAYDELHDGWLFKNRLMDSRDDGYRRFRWMIKAGLPVWLLVITFTKRMMRTCLPRCEKYVLVTLYFLFSCYYHQGAKVILLIFYVMANYSLARLTAGTKYGPFCIWAYNLTWLFFGKQAWFRQILIDFSQDPIWGMGYLHLKFPLWNMTMKNIAYGLDYHWAKLNTPGQHRDVPPDHPEIEYKERVDTHLPLNCYCDIWTYLQYQFYPPLYVEGPIITFNDFMTQYKGIKVQRMETKEVIWYGFRLFLGFIMVEYALHLTYSDALLKTGMYEHFFGSKSQYTNPEDVPVLGGYGLMGFFIWGFLIFYARCFVQWRWGRLWSIIDGIVPPEDYPRCVARARSMSEFWRSWHASMSKWCTRYIYIPFGGSKGTAGQKTRAIFLVFLYMGLWHNLTSEFMVWGGILASFFAMEMVVRWMGKRENYPRSSNRIPEVRITQAPEQKSEWGHRLQDLTSTIPLLGFTLINMGAFTFGFSNLLSIMWLFTVELSGWGLLILGVICNCRWTSINDRWVRSKPNNMVRTD